MEICFATHDQQRFEALRHHLDPSIQLSKLDDLNLEMPDTNEATAPEAKTALITRKLFDLTNLPIIAEDTFLQEVKPERDKEDPQKPLNFGTIYERKAAPPRSSFFQLMTVISYRDEHIARNFWGVTEGTVRSDRSEAKELEDLFIPDGKTKPLNGLEAKERNKIWSFQVALRQLILFLHQAR